MSMPDGVRSDTNFTIIGDEDIVLGFKALGFKVYAVKGKDDTDAALEEVVNQRAAVCLVQENIYKTVADRINSYKNLPVPVFMPFAKKGRTVLFDDIVKDIRLRATGAF